jgi:uncharacterized protein YcfJ
MASDPVEEKRAKARLVLKRQLAKQKLESLQAAGEGAPPKPQEPWLARFASQAGGSTAGALTGGRIGAQIGGGGGPVGRMVGGVIGAGVGAVAGEEGFQSLQRSSGIVDNRSSQQRIIDDYDAFLAGATGQGAGGIVNKGLSELGKLLLRGGGRSTVKSAISSFEVAGGASPTVGQATDSVVWQTLENAAARFPGPHAPILKKARETIGKMETEVNRTASELAMGSDLDRETAGVAIKEGIDTWTERFRRIASQKYDRLDRFMPLDTPTVATDTRATLKKYVTVNPKSPRFTGQFISKKLADTLEGLDMDIVDALARGEGGIPISALRDFRTQIGSRLSEFTLVDDVTRGQVKDLYAAVTKDIRAAASGPYAQPGALKAFDDATAFWQRGMKRVDNFLEGLAKKGIEPEKLFDAVQRGAEGNTMVRELSKTLSPEERKIVGGAILRKLGTAKTADTADFTASTFLNNWNKKVSSEAKDIFFGKSGQSQFRNNLDKIAAVAERIEKSGQIFANPPNTAQALVGTLSYGAAIGAGAGALFGFTDPSFVYTLMAASAGGWAGSKFLITNPKFVNWLASSSRVGGGALSIGNHLGRLGAIAATTNPETNQAIKEYIAFYAGGVADDFLKRQQTPEVPKGQ